MKAMAHIVTSLINNKLPQVFKQTIHCSTRKEFFRLFRTNSHLASHVIDHVFLIMLYCSSLNKIKVESDRHLQPFDMNGIIFFISFSIIFFLPFDNQLVVIVRKYLNPVLLILWTPFICVASLPLY